MVEEREIAIEEEETGKVEDWETNKEAGILR